MYCSLPFFLCVVSDHHVEENYRLTLGVVARGQPTRKYAKAEHMQAHSFIATLADAYILQSGGFVTNRE